MPQLWMFVHRPSHISTSEQHAGIPTQPRIQLQPCLVAWRWCSAAGPDDGMQLCRSKPTNWSEEGAGRVFALEMAFYVAAESISGLGGGLMFDRLLMSTRAVAAVMFAVSACSAARRPFLPPPPPPPCQHTLTALSQPLPSYCQCTLIAMAFLRGERWFRGYAVHMYPVSRSHLIPPCPPL